MATYVRMASTETPHDEEKSHRVLPDISQPRIVSEQQCNVMKRNFQMLLSENGHDTNHPLARHDFTMTFKIILPGSDPTEIEKLFDLIDGDGAIKDNTKTVSFHTLLHNPHNFDTLLSSMGCQLDVHDNNDSDSYTESDTESEEEDLVSPAPQQLSMLPDATSIAPQLSYKHTYSIRSKPNYKSMGQTMKNVNTNNYTEYIKYQKEQIMELKNAVQESNRFEIRCNELQLILDTKHKIIHNLKEEIKHLNVDKNDHMLQINNIRQQYNDLSQKLFDVNSYRKEHEMQEESNALMEEEVQHLKDERTLNRRRSAALKEEQQKLNQLNQQFTHINERLRNELENERRKVQKLTEDATLKDEEVRGLTLKLLSRDQTITQLQNENDDLTTQMNYQLMDVGAESMRIDTADSGVDWGYGQMGQSFYTAQPENLEFDLFQDLHRAVTLRTETSTASTLFEPLNMGFSERCSSGDIVINLAGSKALANRKHKDMDDEKAHEENEWNVDALLNRIRVLEQELRNNTIRTKTSVATQTQWPGFWDALFQNIGCVRDML
eukprot:1061309_1